MLTVKPYIPSVHYNQLVQCLVELQESHSSYPPRNTVTNIQPSAEEWLQDDEYESYRFVATLEDKVVGHICLTAPHDYLVKFLCKESLLNGQLQAHSYMEIGTFFVSPNVQKHGVGHELFSFVLNEADKRGKIAALAVVESHDSHKATSLYLKHGMTNVGFFHGTHGKNLIFVQN